MSNSVWKERQIVPEEWHLTCTSIYTHDTWQMYAYRQTHVHPHPLWYRKRYWVPWLKSQTTLVFFFFFWCLSFPFKPYHLFVFYHYMCVLYFTSLQLSGPIEPLGWDYFTTKGFWKESGVEEGKWSITSEFKATEESWGLENSSLSFFKTLNIIQVSYYEF